MNFSEACSSHLAGGACLVQAPNTVGGRPVVEAAQVTDLVVWWLTNTAEEVLAKSQRYAIALRSNLAVSTAWAKQSLATRSPCSNPAWGLGVHVRVDTASSGENMQCIRQSTGECRSR